MPVCQTEEGRGVSNVRGDVPSYTDLERETSPGPGPVPGSRGGPVPEQLNTSNQQTSLVPSSLMSGGVGVSMMSVAKLSIKKNLDDMNEKLSVALLSVSEMGNKTEPEVSSGQILRSVTIPNL